MYEIQIPGAEMLRLSHLVLDYNGTMALDGKLLSGVADRLAKLAGDFTIHVLTADTFGDARERITGFPFELFVLGEGAQDAAKRDYVRSLGPDACVCIGNGRNDMLMLRDAALGIALIQEECAFAGTVAAADVVALDVNAALDLLLNPLRLKATLRT